MKRTIAAAAIVMGSAAFFTGSAFATQNAQSTMAVSLHIYHECTISTSPLTFTAVGLMNIDQHATATITVQCTQDTPYQIGLDGGLHDGASGADVTKRKLNDGGTHNITYQLYSGGQDTTVWGNTAGTNTVDSAGASNDAEPHTVYATIPAQHAPQGNYSDTITATVWYPDDTP